ncbi:MAG: hypothetical protein PHT44_00055 [Candidatus Portnoybacteria bacterium]|nr:hypothetical protein [Candidatus Portnoybacteria bacterium]MDD4982987.1 hypothetical protein [Candidatus Portnoybacteria bacterium]
MSPYLKDEQYYKDLYDRHTVEECRRLIRISQETKYPLMDGKKLNSKLESGMKKMTLDLMLYFEKGERYINKEETIQKWMAQDAAKDQLYESAQPPTGIRCLSCHTSMVLLGKDLWSGGLNEPDRVLFMFDCPKGCIPRRAFYDNGEEWKVKRDLCPECNTELIYEDRDTKEKFISRYFCKHCGYERLDEITRTTSVEEKPDPDFAKDRDKFCLTKEEGGKYIREKVSLEQGTKLLEEWKERDKNRELYDKVGKIKKLTIVELEKFIVPILEKAGYIKFQLSNPEIGKDIFVPFGVYDSRGDRNGQASEYDLKRLLKKTLKDTNWRLMSDGVSYRLGFLGGRLRGYEKEEDLLKLIQNK